MMIRNMVLIIMIQSFSLHASPFDWILSYFVSASDQTKTISDQDKSILLMWGYKAYEENLCKLQQYRQDGKLEYDGKLFGDEIGEHHDKMVHEFKCLTDRISCDYTREVVQQLTVQKSWLYVKECHIEQIVKEQQWQIRE